MSIKNKRLIAGIILIALNMIIFSGFAFAEGCCFDPDSGFCTQNSLKTSCLDPGEWYASSSCSVDKCELGCCVLGETTEYVTYRTCEILSRAQGFEIATAFQYTDEQACLDLSKSQTYGACIYAAEYEKDCRYVMYSQCPTGEFYEDTYCSDPSLETLCNKTEKTTCFKDDVHYLDSCGNIDDLKEDCDYDSGSTCAAKNGEYICKDLNCEDGRKNGDSWCLFEGTEYQDVWSLVGEEGFVDAPVGSRFFRQYCLNGEVYTEPCADYRMEMCTQGECEINPWQECLSANSEEVDIKTQSKVDEESCDERYCYISRADDCTVILSGGGEHTGEHFCGEARNDYAQYQPDKSQIGESASEMMAELHLEMCLPKIAGGLQLASSESFVSQEGGVCSLGNYEAEIKFEAHERIWWILVEEGLEWGYAGLLINSQEAWRRVVGSIVLLSDQYGDSKGPYSGNHEWTGGFRDHWEHTEDGYVDSSSIPSSQRVLEVLNKRCSGIADCGGKANWAGGGGGMGEEFSDIPVSSSSGDSKTFLFSFECAQWSPSSEEGDCAKCNEDEEIPCSEYRCRSLGKGCEYSEPTGADKGYCVKTSDHRAPAITHTISPASPIEPFTPVEINITTDEISFCKFEIGESGSTYESMEYSVDKNWSKVHRVKLNLPGQLPDDAFDSQYNLITKDGWYEMFVRCVDTADNWNINPYVIKFEVMQNPDKIPPIINLLSFEPNSGFPVKYKASSQNVKFKIDYPAECRWSFDDKSYDLMENEFDCDELISNEGTLNGYFCEGILNGVTNNSESKTDYHIRCKDQPWLSNSNPHPEIYSRNVNTESIHYVLKTSVPLEILDLGPSGKVIVTSVKNEVNLDAVTIGGGYNGKAICKWKLTGNCVNGANLAYTEFEDTNAKKHTDSKSNLSEGDCKIYVKCEDASGNIVNESSSFEIDQDNAGPKVIKTYHFGGDLKIQTDEEAICKYTTDPNLNCGFEWDNKNASLMQGTKLEHSISWIQGKRYYIKCLDYRDNVNKGCAIIIRTY